MSSFSKLQFLKINFQIFWVLSTCQGFEHTGSQPENLSASGMHSSREAAGA